MSAPFRELREALNTLLHESADRFGDPSPGAVGAFTDAAMLLDQLEAQAARSGEDTPTHGGSDQSGA